MFICDICGKQSDRGEVATMYLRVIREKEYFNMKNLETTYGWEIAKEGKAAAHSHRHGFMHVMAVNDRRVSLPFPYSVVSGVVVIPLQRKS